jgi:micrococcal nuclease
MPADETPAAPVDIEPVDPSPSSSSSTEALVIRIVDGDTIEVQIDGASYKVRYIGIDTAEVGDPCSAEATAANRQLVEGETVELEKDVSETDRYGRLLRYVYVGDTMVNAELVHQGFAQVYTYPPDVKYNEEFLDLQREARDAERGCWAVEEETTSRAEEEEEEEDAGDGQFVGSVNSDVYHYPTCSSAKQISPGNKIWFDSVEDAKAHGYRACKKCNPPS